MSAFGNVLKRQGFLLLLDYEIKKAQRYQNYLSLLSLTFEHLNSLREENSSVSLKTVGNLIKDELRETDVVGHSGTNRLMVMLPYADMAGAHKVRKRLKQILQDYRFDRKRLCVEISEVCFPTHGTTIDDLIRISGST